RLGPQPPALAALVRDLRRDQLGGPAVHGPVAGGVHDQVGGQFGAVLQHHAVLGEVVDLALGQLDLAAGDQVGRADLDVGARPSAQVLHEPAGAILAPVVVE